MLRFISEWFARAARIEFHFHAPVTLNVLQASRKRMKGSLIDVTPRAERQPLRIVLAPERRDRLLTAPRDFQRTRSQWSQVIKDIGSRNRF